MDELKTLFVLLPLSIFYASAMETFHEAGLPVVLCKMSFLRDTVEGPWFKNDDLWFHLFFQRCCCYNQFWIKEQSINIYTYGIHTILKACVINKVFTHSCRKTEYSESTNKVHLKCSVS